MKVLKPFYYDEFNCIAGECIDSCCIGWKIDIDKKSYNKYKKIKGAFGKKLNDSITRNRTSNNEFRYGKMKLENKRCVMLNEENLCNLYINLGSNYLCSTCKIYPREVKKYGEIYEKNLSLSCPEVARYLVKNNNVFSFNMDDETLTEIEREVVSYGDDNKRLYSLLWDSRKLAIEIVQFKEISIWKRIVFLKMLCDKVQNVIKNINYSEYEEILKIFRSQITDINIINSLDNISVIPAVKVKFIQSALQIRKNIGINNEKFNNLIDEYNELVKNDDENKDTFELVIEKEKEFNIYLKEYEDIFENLLVYLVYKHFMNAVNTKDLNKECNNIIISYAVIKMLLLARWFKNSKNLTEDDFVEVFYVFSRVIEHNEVFLTDLNNKLKEAGYDTIAYLTILVR